MEEKRELEETQVTSTAEATEQKPGYQTRSWSGLTQYVCPKCGYDTLKKRAIERHVSEGCRPKTKPVKRARRSKPPRVVLRRTHDEE